MNNSESEIQKMELLIGRILAIGTYVAAALLVIGLLLTLRGTDQVFTAQDLFSWSKLVFGFIHLVPDTYLLVGLFFLILTPALRVLVSILLFIQQRDLIYTIITIVVFFILLISMIFGIHG
ncbi:DUF1634 domain-containing protein [uncultured Enterococcus sp.]|uniref:DUF1634 domain-containing protein n=1 Tax=uncultured Enterococcus sp. TaxID=167972 RepID=UPI0025DF504D|nr:DUF1634 domain-containing protein [uncultured Enterococcus sp.]